MSIQIPLLGDSPFPVTPQEELDQEAVVQGVEELLFEMHILDLNDDAIERVLALGNYPLEEKDTLAKITVVAAAILLAGCACVAVGVGCIKLIAP